MLTFCVVKLSILVLASLLAASISASNSSLSLLSWDISSSRDTTWAFTWSISELLGEINNVYPLVSDELQLTNNTVIVMHYLIKRLPYPWVLRPAESMRSFVSSLGSLNRNIGKAVMSTPLPPPYVWETFSNSSFKFAWTWAVASTSPPVAFAFSL